MCLDRAKQLALTPFFWVEMKILSLSYSGDFPRKGVGANYLYLYRARQLAPTPFFEQDVSLKFMVD